MKYKIYTSGYILNMFIFFPIIIFYIITLVIVSEPGSWPYAYLLPTPYLLFLFVRREDYFSIVEISGNGLKATCAGREWFSATWEELQYIGRFSRSFMKGGVSLSWMYFSKAPVELGDDNIHSDAPKNSELNGEGIFMEMTPRSYAEISKYVSKDRIIKCGSYVRGKKTSN